MTKANIIKIEMMEKCEVKADAIKLREFLRMCGFQVNYQTIAETENDLVLHLHTDCGEQQEIILKAVHGQETRKLIEDFLSQCAEYDFFESEENKILGCLKKIYCNNDLAMMIYNVYHFHRVKQAMEKSYTAMLSAYADLFDEKQKYGKKCKSLYYITYARGHLAKKINEIALLYGWGSRIRTPVLIEEIKEVSEVVSNRACSYYLLGQLTFVDPIKRNMSSEYFNKASQYGLSGYFESNMYYYMAATIQEIDQEQQDEEAIKYHKKAVEKNENCYRSRYKIGLYYVKRQQYELALEQFEKIISHISVESTYLQPLEIMYLYKAYQYAAHAKEKMEGQTSEVEDLKNRAKILITDSMVGSSFFADFYKEKQEVYREYMREYMRALNIF